MSNKSNCQNRREAIAALVLGELEAQAVDELKEHIGLCQTCRSLYQALSEEEESIRSAFSAIADRGQAIQEKLVQGSGRESRNLSTRPTRFALGSIFKNKTVKLAAAAVIILVAGIGIAVLSNSLYEEVDPTVGNKTMVDAKRKAELEQIEKMFAGHDIDGLERMLLEGEFQSKIAAASYLAEIGDSNSIAVLEQLDEQYGSSEPVFGEAIEAIEAGTAVPGVQVTSVDEQDMNGVQITGTTTQASDEILQLVPAESLFCVRVNNFDRTVGLIDQYLIGVSPVPVGATMAARMQLAGVLGDPSLSGVNTTGSFAVFATALADEPAGGLMDNMFIAGLIPFADYAKFISSNPNCDEPDANGVSIIRSGGIADPNKRMLITQLGAYGLVSSADAYDKLVSAAKSVSSGRAALGGSLDIGRREAAKTEPLWAYVDIQRASKVFGSVVYARLEQMEKQLETMNASPQGAPAPAGAMNMYFGMFDILTEEVESISISVNPKADVFNLTVTVAAVQQTYLAKMFVADTSGQANTLLGYLQDKAVFNVGIKMNTPFMEELGLTEFDFISWVSDEDISDETAAKLEKLVADMISSAAGPGVVSFAPNEQGWPSFTGKYVIEIKDAEKWDQAIEAAIEAWNSGEFAELYKKMGLKYKFEISRGAEDYNNVSIDFGRVRMDANDPNSAYGKMIDKVYGGGFELRLATVDRLWLCVFGADCNSGIHQLIDQVKAGGPQQTASEVASALATLAEPEEADFVGTANFMRYLNMVGAMLGGVQIGSGGPPIVPVDVETNSNLAFAGKVTNGKMAVEIALPKQHLLEIKAGLETMQQQIAVIMARRQAISQLPLSEADGPITDYTLVREANAPNEESAIEGLHSFAEISNGRYPSSLDLNTVMKEVGEALQKRLLEDPNTPLTQEEVMPKVMQIETASAFYDKLVKDGNDVTYYGTVTTEFPHAVLMYWKVSEDKYRVIFADLAAETITPEKLAELEAVPLNLTPKAIKPDPADGKMAGTISDLKLRWMPGLDAAAHRVYFGTRAEELSLLAEVTTEACDAPPELETDSVYYWRVDEVGPDGSVAIGDVWSFNTNKLCLWWKFDETSGSIVSDSSGNGYVGILTGENNWQLDGYDGQGCLSFDDDTAISVPTEVLSGIDRQITISIRLYGYDSTGRDNYIFETGTNDSFLRAAVPDIHNNVVFWAGGADDVVTWNDSNSADWRGSWKHYVFVKNAGTLTIYCDGRMVAEKTNASSSIKGVRNQSFDIGALVGRMYDYKGKMDDLRIYNYDLSQDEIAQIYNGADPPWQQ
jgi:hypothetical protein